MPDEFAFLPSNRIDGGQIRGAGERDEGRHADCWKRRHLERVSSNEGDLGELNFGPRVIVLLHNFGHGGKLQLVTPLPRSVGGQR